MEGKLVEVVMLTARDSSGDVIREAQINLFDWYDELHPLIDESAVRKAAGIRSIDGVQYDTDGTLMKRWRVNYDVNGSVIDSEELPS